MSKMMFHFEVLNHRDVDEETGESDGPEFTSIGSFTRINKTGYIPELARDLHYVSGVD